MGSEMCIRDRGYIYWGGFGEIKFHRYPAYTEQDRVDIFTKYYNYIYNSDINGSFFWNLGYEGMREELFDGCESLEHSEGSTWTIDPASDATAISVSSAYFTQGTNSFKCDYTYSVGKAHYQVSNLAEMWEVTATSTPEMGAVNRAKFMFDIYNPAGAAGYVDVFVCTTAALTWHESEMQPLDAGWNTIMVDLSSETWKSAATGWNNNGEIANLDEVRQVGIGIFGYSGSDSVYIDNISIFDDDGFVIYYPDDPVCSTISNHASQMSVKHEPFVNHSPTLDWTGEAGYTNDGLSPETGLGATTFTYRIKYTDVDNDAPVVYKVYIDKNGDGDYTDTGEVNDMTGEGATYSSGVIYSYSTTVPYSSGSTNCKYYFQFSDGIVYATGNITEGISAAAAINAPDVYQTLSVSVNPSVWGIGTVNLSATPQTMTQGNKIMVTNDGDGAETFTLKLTDEDDRDEWTHSAIEENTGLNKYVINALFCALTDSPTAGGFNEGDSEDVITTTLQTATEAKFAYGGGGDNGTSVLADESVSLWLRLDLPTAVSGTYQNQQHTLAVQIGCKVP